MKCVFTLDIGGSTIKAGKFDLDGVLVDYFETRTNVDKDDPVNSLINYLKEIIDNVKASDEIEYLGIAVPGPVRDGVVLGCENINWGRVELQKILEEIYPNIKIAILNDANAATLGEWYFGSGEKVNNLIMVTVGTGIGGGIVIDGKLFEGNLGKGAEFGHALLVMDGRPCGCGRKGCLEAYASATALVNDAKEMMEEHKDSKMWKIKEDLGVMDARVPFEAAKQGDEYAEILINNYVKYLSEGLINYFNIFRPEAVILSGGVAEEGEFLISKIRKYCEERFFGLKMSPPVDVIKSMVGYDAGKIGAAALFF